MSGTPRSDGVSCPVPVVLSGFRRRSFSPSRGSVGVSLLWETCVEVECNIFVSTVFHPAGVEIWQEGRRWFPAVVGPGKALPVGFPLRDPVLLFQILWAVAHNLVANPLVWVGRVSGSVMLGVVWWPQGAL